MFLELVFVIKVDDVFLKIIVVIFFILSFGGSENRRNVFDLEQSPIDLLV